MTKIEAQCEWYFIPGKGPKAGPFKNAITPDGLGLLAQAVEQMPSPFLVIGDDTDPGFTITEIFRKAVSSVVASGNLIRFRTILLPGEADGTHQKFSIFYGGTEVLGSGTMFNLLALPWNKAVGTILTVEARINITEVVG